MNAITDKQKRTDRLEHLARMVEHCQQKSELESWSHFAKAVNIPTELYPAVMAGRPELLNLLAPRPLDQAQCTVMFELIKTLIATNMALRSHAQEVSILVGRWAGEFKALDSIGRQIEDFASFTTTIPNQEDAA